MDKNFGKIISKSFNGKYISGMLVMRKKILDHAKQFAADTFKTASKRASQKKMKETDDLIGNKVANKITWVSKI